MTCGFLHSKGTHQALIWSLVAGGWAAIVVALDLGMRGNQLPVTEAVLTLGMGLLVGLRVNRAYERWWEGRKLWGKLVNVSRNLAVKARAFADPDPTETEDLKRTITGFAVALKHHLREGAALERIPGFEARTERPAHVPSWLARRLYDVLYGWRREGRITDQEMRTLDLEARELLEICGACERIRNTPMPPSLPALTRLTLTLVLFGLPLLLENPIGWWSVPSTAAAAFFTTVGETTAAVVEHPFGTDPNELDLDRLCTVVETSVGEILDTGVTA